MLKGVYVLKTSSNQSSPLANLIPSTHIRVCSPQCY